VRRATPEIGDSLTAVLLFSITMGVPARMSRFKDAVA
jgi:hypothetical protein